MVKFLILFLIICSPSFAETVTVYEKPDGSIAIVTWVDPENRKIPAELVGLPHWDIDTSDIPQDRTRRNAWRYDKTSKKVFANPDIVTPQEQDKINRKSAKDKFKVLGLTDSEIKTLIPDPVGGT